MHLRSCLLPILALFLLLPTAATAGPFDAFKGGYADTYGTPLTLTASGFLGRDDALPYLQAAPDADAYFGAWPSEVTLRCYRFGPKRMVKRVAMIVGGIHGDEAVSYILPELLIRQLLRESESPHPGSLYQRLIDTGTQLYIVPLVNPYGTLAGVRPNFRTPNAIEWMKDELSASEWPARPEWWERRKGVDLNRNFPVNLDCGGAEFQRPDGEGTHEFAAPGGCYEQELYYGSLLAENGCAVEPANAWLHGLVEDIQPDVLVALHQEARIIYVDLGTTPDATTRRDWAHVIDETHDYLNTFLEPISNDYWSAVVEFGLTKDGDPMDSAIAVNDFSPGGYGAALSLFSGAVITVEMTHNQSDAFADTCWFPEGVLYTYAPDLRLSSLRNVDRLTNLIGRFKAPILNYIFHLDPTRPDRFSMSPPQITREAADVLLLPDLNDVGPIEPEPDRPTFGVF